MANWDAKKQWKSLVESYKLEEGHPGLSSDWDSGYEDYDPSTRKVTSWEELHDVLETIPTWDEWDPDRDRWHYEVDA